MKKASMQDIADSLGISKNSVSHAFRDTDGVSESTKYKVYQKADELGYVYKKQTQNIERGIISILATNFAFSQTSFFGELIDHVENNLKNNNYTPRKVIITKDMINSNTIDSDLETSEGIIIISHSNNQFLEKIISLNIPTVIVDHHEPNLIADAVLSKNTDGTYFALSLLAQNGHKTVGFIGDIAFSPSYLERYKGFCRGIKDFNLSSNPNIQITSIEETQGALFNSLKEVEIMPDAWFCVNSGLAFMLNSYLQSNGYTIPDDVSVICFDDTEFTRLAQPTITNIATDLKYMAKVSVETLMDRIDNPENPIIHKQIVPSININQSVKII